MISMPQRSQPALAFTDLDNTLIYPARLATGRWLDPGRLLTVERMRGQAATVMPRDAARIWSALVADSSVIPVTTRTTAQYTALTLPGSRPRIAITGNGADILHDAVPDPAWREHVQRILASTSAPFDQVSKELSTIARRSATLGRPFAADGLYVILGTRTPPFPGELLAELVELTQPLGWRTVVHGRRIYALPTSLDKQLAVQRVAADHGTRQVFAAGDSELDEQMLLAATAAIRPPHGALHQRGWTTTQGFIAASSGLTASQEIMAWLATRMRDTHYVAVDG
jgi:phosphoserine phosphatase